MKIRNLYIVFLCFINWVQVIYLVYVPHLNINDADKVISNGYRVVFGNNLNTDFEKDALNLKCQYIWQNNSIVKLEP